MTADRLIPSAVLASSLGALAAALTGQYVYGLLPCILCLWQRVPYGLAALIAGLALLPAFGPRGRAWLVAVCGLAFLANAGIAGYHVGVEQGWWAGTAGCTGGGVTAATVDDLQRLLAQPPAARCDDVPWTLFGISMAGYNILASLALSAFAFWGATHISLRRTQ
ncbi:disulfide bond formation protein B [Telmatospirillum sp. J64-1]|uniref:disulfide bond formation protein B n=1 Tax=Telmatospirillum sp. J64-1 TaxID=2502183 RepID=UPI00115D4C89|nr:disulfide bond formation protein B [Telmatospirillum sp. J64-1]